MSVLCRLAGAGTRRELEVLLALVADRPIKSACSTIAIRDEAALPTVTA